MEHGSTNKKRSEQTFQSIPWRFLDTTLARGSSHSYGGQRNAIYLMVGMSAMRKWNPYNYGDIGMLSTLWSECLLYRFRSVQVRVNYYVCKQPCKL